MFHFPVLHSIIYCSKIAMLVLYVSSVTISTLCIVSSISKIGVFSIVTVVSSIVLFL